MIMKTILKAAPPLLMLVLSGCYVTTPTPVAYAPSVYYTAPPSYYYAPAYYGPYPAYSIGVYGGGYYRHH